MIFLLNVTSLRKQTELVSKIPEIEEMKADMHYINLSKYIWQHSIVSLLHCRMHAHYSL